MMALHFGNDLPAMMMQRVFGYHVLPQKASVLRMVCNTFVGVNEIS
jgi:hypothetical protein